MSTDGYQCTALQRGYARYLRDRNVAAFIAWVHRHYTLNTLHRVATTGDRSARRAAVLAISYLGNSSSVAIAGAALRDHDRGVRMLAEETLRALHERQLGPWGFQQMRILKRYNWGERYLVAERFSHALLGEAPRFVEAWYQRAIALAGSGHYREAIASCRRAAALSRYHYPSLARMGDYHLMLGATPAAMDAYRKALQLHPGLEHVRACFQRVRRTMEER